jgi:hypothetical protein
MKVENLIAGSKTGTTCVVWTKQLTTEGNESAVPHVGLTENLIKELLLQLWLS